MHKGTSSDKVKDSTASQARTHTHTHTHAHSRKETKQNRTKRVMWDTGGCEPSSAGKPLESNTQAVCVCVCANVGMRMWGEEGKEVKSII